MYNRNNNLTKKSQCIIIIIIIFLCVIWALLPAINLRSFVRSLIDVRRSHAHVAVIHNNHKIKYNKKSNKNTI